MPWWTRSGRLCRLITINPLQLRERGRESDINFDSDRYLRNHDSLPGASYLIPSIITPALPLEIEFVVEERTSLKNQQGK